MVVSKAVSAVVAPTPAKQTGVTQEQAMAQQLAAMQQAQASQPAQPESNTGLLLAAGLFLAKILL
jgi:hypothetical protein